METLLHDLQVWLTNSSWVFYIGASFAVCSLLLSLLIPNQPALGNETKLNRQKTKGH